MKKRNLFITLGLAMGLGLGVAAGLGARQEVKEAKATGVPEFIYLDWTHSDWSSWGPSSPTVYAYFMNSSDAATGSGWHGNAADGTTLLDSVTYYKFTVPASSAKVVFSFTQAGWGDTNNHQTVNLTIPTDGKDCFSLDNDSSSGEGVKYDGTWSVYGGLKHTVTKMAVEFVGGIAQSPADWGLGEDSIPDGESHSVPGTTYKNLEHFDGWYTNTACTTPYTGTASVTAPFTIYAKYERLTVDSYIYWLDKNSTDMTKVYFFNEYAPTAWPGDDLSTYKVSDVLKLENQGKIYKIPVPSSGNIKLVLNNNNNVKTYDIDVTGNQGKLLYTWYDTLTDGTYFYNGTFNVNSGLAADFLIEVEAARNAVAAAGNILQYSICGISSGTAATLCKDYNDLSADVRGLVNSSVTYTYSGKYDGEHVPSETNVNFYDIMEEIAELAGGVSLEGHSAGKVSQFFPNEVANANNTAIIIAIVSGIALIGVASYFLLRRKKED